MNGPEGANAMDSLAPSRAGDGRGVASGWWAGQG
jgi:hypothetical protein